ncbi:MAG: hypothetical protein ABJA02_16735, partial [Acidobacteriota bacterium]
MRYALLLMIFSTLGYSQTPPIGPGVSHDLAVWRAAHYSDVRYKLNLTLEKMSPVLKGTIEIRVKVGARSLLSASPGTQAPSPANAGSSGVTAPIILDWRKIAGHEKDSTITNVTLNGNVVKSSWSLLEIGPGLIRPPRSSATSQSVSPSPITSTTPTPSTSVYQENDDHLLFEEGVVAGENVIKLDFTSPILTSG